MSPSIKPPRRFFIPTSVLAARPPELLMQSMAALASVYGGQLTLPPASSRLTGKPERSLNAHLTAHRNFHSALRLQGAGSGLFVTHFAAWLQLLHSLKPGDCRILQLPDHKEELTISEDSLSLLLDSVNDHTAENCKISKKKSVDFLACH